MKTKTLLLTIVRRLALPCLAQTPESFEVRRAEAAFEELPVLNASEILRPEILAGLHHKVREPVLQHELDGIAWASFAGGATFSLTTVPIGGGAGAALTVTDVTSSFDEMLREKSPTDLKIINRKGEGTALHLIPEALLMPMRPHAFAALVLCNFGFPPFL
jgi:hypothetical protein